MGEMQQGILDGAEIEALQKLGEAWSNTMESVQRSVEPGSIPGKGRTPGRSVREGAKNNGAILKETGDPVSRFEGEMFHQLPREG
jgi:hypothetical protein